MCNSNKTKDAVLPRHYMEDVILLEVLRINIRSYIKCMLTLLLCMELQSGSLTILFLFG